MGKSIAELRPVAGGKGKRQTTSHGPPTVNAFIVPDRWEKLGIILGNRDSQEVI
jgi:hypothetical protein